MTSGRLASEAMADGWSPSRDAGRPRVGSRGLQDAGGLAAPVGRRGQKGRRAAIDADRSCSMRAVVASWAMIPAAATTPQMAIQSQPSV